MSAKGPRTRVCYVCGRQYGLTSFEIHLKQCKELWVAREEKKDPKERKPLPEDPALGMTASPTTQSSSNRPKTTGGNSTLSLDEINRMATDTFNNVSLSKCEYCNRSFLPEKLLIHNKSCTADKPARRVDESVNRRLGASNDRDQAPQDESPQRNTSEKFVPRVRALNTPGDDVENRRSLKSSGSRREQLQSLPKINPSQEDDTESTIIDVLSSAISRAAECESDTNTAGGRGRSCEKSPNTASRAGPVVTLLRDTPQSLKTASSSSSSLSKLNNPGAASRLSPREGDCADLAALSDRKLLVIAEHRLAQLESFTEHLQMGVMSLKSVIGELRVRLEDSGES